MNIISILPMQRVLSLQSNLALASMLLPNSPEGVHPNRGYRWCGRSLESLLFSKDLMVFAEDGTNSLRVARHVNWGLYFIAVSEYIVARFIRMVRRCELHEQCKW